MGSWVLVQTGADLEDDAEFFSELDRAGLHNFGAEAGQFQHFIVRNLFQFPGVRHQARVGGINAVHIGINLAQIGLKSRCQSDGREVGAAAPERGDLPFNSLSLKTGDDHDVALVQQLVDSFRGDILNFGFGMNAISHDAGLGPREGDRRHFERVKRDGR
jgi:2-polyprenyl-6-hydroxyphenyl methylase/3-demethylubiquinone-9 3-methyltransferase